MIDELRLKKLNDLRKEINRGLGWGIVAYNVDALAEKLVSKYGIEIVSDIINNHVFFDTKHEYSDITNKWTSRQPYSLERTFDLILNSRPAFIDAFVEKLIDIEREKGLNRENMGLTKNKLDEIEIDGYVGSWYVIDERETEMHGTIYLLEHEEYGDETYCIIIDSNKNILLEDVWNGFLDYEEAFIEKSYSYER
jgi:hypothetical protein